MKKPTATSHSKGSFSMACLFICLILNSYQYLAGWTFQRNLHTKKPLTGSGFDGTRDKPSFGHYAEKLEPQPQVVVALGFLITNCAPCRSSL